MGGGRESVGRSMAVFLLFFSAVLMLVMGVVLRMLLCCVLSSLCEMSTAMMLFEAITSSSLSMTAVKKMISSAWKLSCSLSGRLTLEE